MNNAEIQKFNLRRNCYEYFNDINTYTLDQHLNITLTATAIYMLANIWS
jgi:hypothetical protein